MGIFSMGKGKNKYYYLVTYIMDNNKFKMVVISLRGAKNEAEANQMAYDKMKGRTFHILESASSQLSEATREAKAKHFFETGNLEDSVQRASHDEEIE